MDDLESYLHQRLELHDGCSLVFWGKLFLAMIGYAQVRYSTRKSVMRSSNFCLTSLCSRVWLLSEVANLEISFLRLTHIVSNTRAAPLTNPSHSHSSDTHPTSRHSVTRIVSYYETEVRAGCTKGYEQ